MEKVLHTKWGNAKINNGGYFVITSVKEGNHGKYLHRLIWEDFYNTEVPKGYVIHHKNFNKLDNCVLNNLQLMRDKDHRSLHSDGENHPFFSKKRPEHSEMMLGENNPSWKDYPRIVKNGKNRYGKQVYAIRFNGKYIKCSIDKNKLIRWFEKEYPNIIIEEVD